MCAALGQHRSTQRKLPRGRDDEERLAADIVEFARQYGRYGYRKVAELLRSTAGWVVNDKRVERIWRREGLKVPAKQPKRGRLWLADGSCVRLRAERPNHVWSYDFVEDRTHEGRKYRMLNLIDEFTHECLAIRVARKLKATDVIDVLSDLFLLRGVPGHIRSDNGPEFVAKAVQGWITAVGARTAYIAPGSPLQGHHRGPDPCGTGSTALLSMGERLHRELQRPAPRRAARRRDLLQLARGPGGDRGLAAPLQRGAPACFARLPRPGAGGVRARLRHAAPTSLTGSSCEAGHPLTFTPDYLAGDGQLLGTLTRTIP